MPSTRWLPLLLFSLAAHAAVTVTQHADNVAVDIDGKPDTTFFFGPGVNKPYVYPLRTAGGIVVSRGWPMDPRPGETHDHIHHRGIWFAHASVNGFDFWNSDPSYKNPKMGRIAVTRIDNVSSGAEAGTVKAELDWLDPQGHAVLHEIRTMTFHSGVPRMIDFDITLTAPGPVIFGDEKDGVFGLRLAPELEEHSKDSPAAPVRTGIMTGSNGCRQEEQCWGKRGDWVDVSGKVEGKTVGVAIFDSPANPRYPTNWHARGYGLLAANIFGAREFDHDPRADGSLTMEPGSSLHFRYRVVAHDGDGASAGIAALDKSWREQK